MTTELADASTSRTVRPLLNDLEKQYYVLDQKEGMSTEEVQRKVTRPVEQRSLTGSAAADVALAFAGGAGAAMGKVVIDQIAQHVTKPKDEKPKIVLPDDKER